MQVFEKTSLIIYATIFINKFIEVEFLGQRVYTFKIVVSAATLFPQKLFQIMLL